MIAPQPFRWTGEAMVPLRPLAADRQFVVGECYTLVEHQQRSMASHGHEFAWLAEAWRNLPEGLADEFPDPESLRKRALIEAGFYHQSEVDCGSHAAAIRVATFVRAEDRFCVAVVRGPIVVKRVAESQSLRSMGRERFQASKDGIIRVVSEMIGVAPEALQQARAA